MKTLLRLLLRVAAFMHRISYRVISEAAIRLERGLHPKHRIMNYHDFFLNNIRKNDVVLDVGCGRGAVANTVAKKAKRVVGVDFNRKSIAFASKRFSKDNLFFLAADITKHQFKESFNVIILSNVLEHIKNRVSFLKKLSAIAPRVLIRVPLINRSWLPVYLKELGLEYRLDKTHYIEYTEELLEDEVRKAGLRLDSYYVRWGEMYAVCSRRTQ